MLASIIIFFTAIPISYHAAKYNIDIDLITRSAGFGYVGSTITSLIYASFSFIFFALEAAILAQALLLYFGLPLAWGYLLSSLVIIPLVFYGITFINKLQLWTQPIWFILMILPFLLILYKQPEVLDVFYNLKGIISGSSEFNLYYFGIAVGISLSLIAQIGEQVDYLRFMPPLKKENRLRWWTSLLIAGPGWIILGFLKQIGGVFLASLVLLSGLSIAEAKTPIEMYNVGYQYVFDNPSLALGVATLFVIISQIKINVTNAYAGSLAWSNFFSRVTHSHPGRVVWMVFNISIALLLMELGLFDALEKILGLYSNVAIAWIGAITADLIINKPFGLSPKIIEFKRAYLYNINPVGVGSMGVASVISIISFMGFFGDLAQSYSSLIAMFLSFLLSPIIAYITQGKYYIARPVEKDISTHCEICDIEYEKEDMGYCPLHQVNICSLCCSLDSLCHDSCKKEGEKSLRQRIGELIQKVFLHRVSIKASLRIFDFVGLSSIFMFMVVVSMWMVYSVDIKNMSPEVVHYIQNSFFSLFIISMIFVSVLVWWILLTHENRVLAEEELEEQYETLKVAQLKSHHQAQMIEQTHDSVISTDLDGIIVSFNHGSEVLLGYTADEIIGKHITVLYLEEDYPLLEENITYLMKNGEHNIDTRLMKKSKIMVDVDLSLSILRDEENNATGMVGYAQDITERKRAKEELIDEKEKLAHQASHDMLTGLPNRILFIDRLQYNINKAKRNKTKVVLFFIDLDHFKEINDSLGHDIGDEVLKTAASRIQKSIRDIDTVARLGGDEFTVILEEVKNAEDASLIADNILKNLSKVMEINEHKLYISSSIGISIYPNDGEETQDLIKYADSAMYKAKSEGRNNFQFYSVEMTKLAHDRVVMETDLRGSLKNEDFVVYFQPQINAEYGALIGMEALVRWEHPRLGFVGPDKFIPLAESTGLIVALDRYVMKTAMKQFVKWYKQGFNPGVLALNLSIKQLQQKDFMSMLDALLEETGCKTEWIELEVTESQIMIKPEATIQVLEEISKSGVKLAIDDFGTGYSSLSYLKKLPIDKLKIDREFVKDLPLDENDVGIAKAIIALAESLNLDIIAEGVETKEQKDFLVEHNCYNIQGYFYAKPMKAEEIQKGFLED